VSHLLTAARTAFEQRRWADAVHSFQAAEADDAASLTAPDHDRLAVAAYLAGDDDTSVTAFESAHRAHLDDGEIGLAVRAGTWLGITLVLRGDMAQAGGWFARCGRLVEAHQPAGSHHALLILTDALGALHGGDFHTALDHATAAGQIARAHHDADVAALALCTSGQALVAADRPADAVICFDEAMVSVTAGEVSPIPAGIVYCALIAECMALLDLRRAGEWTESLSRWCATQPDLVPYRGQCLVHRSQILASQGQWGAAADQADKARTTLAETAHPALGLACYQQAELHRLRGEEDEAEAAYAAASEAGHDPLPGLALLRLAQGVTDAAVGSVNRALAEAHGAGQPTLLSAAVEIRVARGDVDGAADVSRHLDDLARALDAPVVTALSALAHGRVARAQGRPSDALGHLRTALAYWRDLTMPYEAARTRELMGLACHDVGDADGCRLELDAARRAYEELGAAHDLGRISDAIAELRDGDTDASVAEDPAGLTDREREVLSLVAAGHTNRQISEQLIISQHTVGRHVQNIFAKLGVSSRAAATAYAYEHQLV
jgi:ATP/maltotriose-dependent transcriptional regulator MalT